MGRLVKSLRRLAAYPDRTEEQRRPYLILLVVCSAMFLDLSNLSAVTIALPTMGDQLGVDQSQLQWVIAAYALTLPPARRPRRRHLWPPPRPALRLLLLRPLHPRLRPRAHLCRPRHRPGLSGHRRRLHHPLGPGPRRHLLPEPVGARKGPRLLGRRRLRRLHRRPHPRRRPDGPALVALDLLDLPRPVRPRHPRRPPGSPPARGRHAPDSGKRLWGSLRARLVRFDAVGICLGVPGLLLLTYALTSGNISGWGAPSIVSTLVLAVVLLVLFALQESRASQALISPRLFDSLSFTMTLVLAVATYAVRQACSYFLTLQLQSYGNSPLRTALLFLPVGVSALLANSVAGRLVPVLGARAMFVLGWALCIPGVLFSFITPDTSYWRFTFPGMILYIAGLGVVYITANFVVVSSAAKSDQGAVAGVFNVALQVGGSVLGLAVLTAVAEGIDSRFGHVAGAELSEVGYQSVYYSCIILCAIALLVSLLAVKVPDAMRGTIWKKKAEPAELREMPAPPRSGPELDDSQLRDENPFGSSSSSAVDGTSDLAGEHRRVEQNVNKP